MSSNQPPTDLNTAITTTCQRLYQFPPHEWQSTVRQQWTRTTCATYVWWVYTRSDLGGEGYHCIIRSGDGEDEVLTKNEELGRRQRPGNGEWGAGGWRVCVSPCLYFCVSPFQFGTRIKIIIIDICHIQPPAPHSPFPGLCRLPNSSFLVSTSSSPSPDLIIQWYPSPPNLLLLWIWRWC